MTAKGNGMILAVIIILGFIAKKPSQQFIRGVTCDLGKTETAVITATSVVLNTELRTKSCSPGDKEWITHVAQGWAPLGRQRTFLCPHYSALGFP